MRRGTIIALAIVLLVLAAMAAKSVLISVPPLREHNAPGEFDAGRAKGRLAAILGDQRPHAADSEADDLVRARLVVELKRMGFEPIVRDQVICNDFQRARLVACARVRNVIAIVGPPRGKALLLSAHYDSVPVGPGASDDGVGVATLLEVGSFLKQRPLSRPVILLFNEGEELGLIGARAFLADPLSRNVDSLLNFEARGVNGPVTMFETSRPNGAAISVFGHAVRRPVASSMSTDIARLIPNDTDVTAYKERGWLTLNFAMVGNETRYHSPGDDVAGLDPRSLQHMGDQALATATELAAGVPQARGNRIFFDLAGRWLIQMPMAIGIGLFLLLVAAFAGIAWKRGAIVREPATILGAVVAGGVLAWVAVSVMGALRAGTYWRAHPEIAFVAIYATVLFGTLAVLRTFGTRMPKERLRVAFWALFLLIGGALAFLAPGAIIYFLFPPGLVLLGIVAGRRYPGAETVGAFAGLFLLFLTWGEMLALLEQIFSPGPLWIVAPVGAIMIAPVLIEAHELFGRASRRALLLGSTLIALIAWAGAGFAPAYSRDHRQRFTIEHLTQFPSGKSSWSVLDDGADLPDAYSDGRQWRRGKLPFSERQRWLASAPAVAGLRPAAIRPLEIVRNGNERTIRLRLEANGAERITLVAPEDAHIRAAGVPGFVRPLGSGDSSGKFTISCTGRSCDRMELTIVQGTARPMVLTVVGARNGLPPSAEPLIAARPALARPQYTPDETVTVARAKL